MFFWEMLNVECQFNIDVAVTSGHVVFVVVPIFILHELNGDIVNDYMYNIPPQPHVHRFCNIKN